MSHKKDAMLIWVKLELFVGYIPLLLFHQLVNLIAHVVYME